MLGSVWHLPSFHQTLHRTIMQKNWSCTSNNFLSPNSCKLYPSHLMCPWYSYLSNLPSIAATIHFCHPPDPPPRYSPRPASREIGITLSHLHRSFSSPHPHPADRIGFPGWRMAEPLSHNCKREGCRSSRLCIMSWYTRTSQRCFHVRVSLG